MAIAPNQPENKTKPLSSEVSSSDVIAPEAHEEAEDITVSASAAGRQPAKFVGLSWPSIIWLSAVHIGVLAAPFVFTWQAVVLVVALHWLTGGVGVCLGFHRLLTHSSFKTSKPVRYLLAWIGGMAGEGPAIQWIADHRKHHALSDQPGDPHSPHDGPWWGHMLWLGPATSPADHEAHLKYWAPDLMKEPVLRFLSRTFLLWQFVFAGALLGAGYLVGGWHMGWSFLVWGMFVRMTLVLHSTWFVNSASHMWGYRNYKTTDDSRNNWWVAIIAYGEGWHNNHHAYPRMANHGHRWWEYDLTFRTIRLLQRLGLAWDVVDYKQKKVSDKAKVTTPSQPQTDSPRRESSRSDVA